jgi:hypothetical protein
LAHKITGRTPHFREPPLSVFGNARAVQHLWIHPHYSPYTQAPSEKQTKQLKNSSEWSLWHSQSRRLAQIKRVAYILTLSVFCVSMMVPCQTARPEHPIAPTDYKQALQHRYLDGKYAPSLSACPYSDCRASLRCFLQCRLRHRLREKNDRRLLPSP